MTTAAWRRASPWRRAPACRRPPTLSEPGPNAFAGASLDRVGSRRRDATWLAALHGDRESRALTVTREGIHLRDERPALTALATLTDLDGAGEPLLLGLAGTTALFAVDLDAADPGAAAAALADAQLVDLREAASRLAQADGGLAAYASALAHWHRRHRFCANCGAPTTVAEGGHLRRCPHCGVQHHPRTDPVVIMLVADGDRVLLGRQPSWPAGRYSALAGFVEPGESLEEAVSREVAEEAGVVALRPRYASSQPWPFPSSLMLGFTADYGGGTPVARDGELEDVRWVARAELRSAAAGGGPIHLPPPIAIARRLIDGWLAGRD